MALLSRFPTLFALVFAGLSWVYWLVVMEAGEPGWCRKLLQRLDLHTWHGCFDWLSTWCLLAAVATDGHARPWLLLGYLVSAAGRYATRPRPARVHITLHR